MPQYLPINAGVTYMSLEDANSLKRFVSNIDTKIEFEVNNFKATISKHCTAIGPEIDNLELAIMNLRKRIDAVFNSVDTGNG